MTLFVTTLLVGLPALAGSWSVPALDLAQQELWLVNSSALAETAWVAPAHLDANTNNEIAVELAPRSRQKVDFSTLGSSPWFQVKSRDNVKLQVLIKNLQLNKTWLVVPEGRSKKRGLQTSDADAVFINNLSPISQEGLILVQLRTGGIWRRNFRMEAFESAKVSLPETEFQQIQVEGEMPLLATAHTSRGPAFLNPIKEDVYPSKASRFVLTNSSKTQSYVVELTDPLMIAQAREQIAKPSSFQARILFAEIGSGPNSINQDLSHWAQGSWSWHVSRPLKFGELASQSCDGSPEFIEDFLSAWLKSGSIICFWGYKVTEELR